MKTNYSKWETYRLAGFKMLSKGLLWRTKFSLPAAGRHDNMCVVTIILVKVLPAAGRNHKRAFLNGFLAFNNSAFFGFQIVQKKAIFKVQLCSL